MQETTTHLPAILETHEVAILEAWLKEQTIASTNRLSLAEETERRQQSKELLTRLRTATQSGYGNDIMTAAWEPVRELLANISQTRTRKGYTVSETAIFIFSLKSSLFVYLQQEITKDAVELATETWAVSQLIDRLGLYTMDVFQRSREEVIARQQQELLELSTPVVKLWEGILALPLIGTLDSARTQVVMESLLSMIAETGSEIVIIDITGVVTVDTLVAQHLLKAVAAARLMGTDCIISGIRPQIAQTIVHLGVDLSTVITKATMAEAFKTALQRQNFAFVRNVGRA